MDLLTYLSNLTVPPGKEHVLAKKRDKWLAERGWIVESIPCGHLACNCTIIAGEGGVVICDPGGEELLAVLQRLGGSVTDVLISHAHFDHVLGVKAVLDLFPKSRLVLHEADLDLYKNLNGQLQMLAAMGLRMPPQPEPPKPTHLLRGDETLHVAGDSKLECRVLATPGHTPGSVCFHFPLIGLLVSGDTLFRRGIGRTDLPGGSAERIAESCRRLYAEIPHGTRVICGHGEETTVGDEAKGNPFVRAAM